MHMAHFSLYFIDKNALSSPLSAEISKYQPKWIWSLCDGIRRLKFFCARRLTTVRGTRLMVRRLWIFILSHSWSICRFQFPKRNPKTKNKKQNCSIVGIYENYWRIFGLSMESGVLVHAAGPWYIKMIQYTIIISARLVWLGFIFCSISPSNQSLIASSDDELNWSGWRPHSTWRSPWQSQLSINKQW